MRYEEPERFEREDLARAQMSGDAGEVCSVLIGLVFHDGDWKWLQDTCLGLMDHDAGEVRTCAVTGMGHIARMYGNIEKDVVTHALERMRMDSKTAGAAENALEDIHIFSS
ncbi:hypothetical protein FHX37_2818 [Haloactinospora alba]|uniref:HEAT repeat protein n=1 Tax=Haloactinospora alba TaxID=405555 RepID=A0A543NM01_9ACTN|nr:hypothetical protein [Haloactinospora alba]TQN32834.1 hypothetical protein FHX37_2818 [Haloactinospora alba]